MIEQLTKYDIYIAMGINGLITGFSVAIGNYLAQKHAIKGTKKIIRKIKRGFKKRKNGNT
jgi:hypothetical protein